MNDKKYRNESIRLKNYDYSQQGAYFITICTHYRESMFGYVKNNKIILNDAGLMLKKWYFEMENKYPNIRCYEYVVMPNHFHCIIAIMGNQDAHVGAPLRGRPSPENREQLYGPNNKKYNATIPQMIDWFKTMTTNEYIRGVKKNNWPRFNRKLWQQNYYDNIIRTNNDLIRIRKYIINNPLKWELDRMYSGNVE